MPPLNKTGFRYNKELGGGSLNDAGAYPVFMSRFILGENPIAVTCSLNYDREKDVDIQGSALLEFPNGKKAVISFGFNNLYQNNYSVWGSKGLVKANKAYSIPKDLPPDIILLKNDGTKETQEKIELQPSNQFLLGFKAFSEAVLENSKEKREEKYREILAQARVMQALRDSDKEKKRIEL